MSTFRLVYLVRSLNPSVSCSVSKDTTYKIRKDFIKNNMSTSFLIGLKRHKVIAGVLALSLVLWATGMPGWGLRANAAMLTSVSDTLSDSDVNVASNHTIAFTVTNGILADQTVAVTFPAGFDLSTVLFSDVDFGSTTVEFTVLATPSGASWGAEVDGQTLTLTNGSAAVASGTPMVLKIGTNASTGGAGVNRIVNPGAGSYEIHIGGTMPSSGYTRVMILDDVVVTAAVSTTFTFTVSSVAIGETVNNSATTTSTTTSATSIPFGVLQENVSKTAAQDLTVATNAKNGFVVTLIQDQNLTSSSGADIDTFKNGSDTATPEAWTTPTNVLGSENTYGHLGITSEDDLNADEFGGATPGSDLWAGNLSPTVPRQVFSHNGPADGSTANIGRTRIGFQVEIESLQEAGNDYTNTLTYVATPTF